MKQAHRNSRSDSVADKLKLLESASSERQYDLAMSLVASIKDSLDYLHQADADPDQPQLDVQHAQPVDQLPDVWAQWAAGWSHWMPVTLFDQVGIARNQEPVELTMACSADQATDLHREVRVARIDEELGRIEEVPSQTAEHVRREKRRSCKLIFPADVPLHGRADYLVLFGNPNAERPSYTSDLSVQGAGYGLQVTNQHYVASLSKQMGQLERLGFRRQHSLELYAGGKGHGEPPTIDWAHDYVDEGSFQKLRMRNWSQCPNHQVVRGPLAVRVRRWGFPHSPIHPVFTPSRIHMDVTYTFYAGLPYFFKSSRFDVVKGVKVDAMRDDEWVFSGYSFTNMLWIDRGGKLHEGAVPDTERNDLWGVGFFHRQSRDAFVALWLEHTARGLDRIQHSGPPTLHYDGHGQLWSRYPVESAHLAAGTSLHQKNAYLVTTYPEPGGAERIEQLRHQLGNPLEVRCEGLMPVRRATAAGRLARDGETAETAPLKPAIWRVLREVRDDQLYKIDANVVDLGLIYDVRVRSGTVEIVMTTPHAGRPVVDFYVTQGGGRVEEGIQERLLKIDGVRHVIVRKTDNPPWTVSQLTYAARRSLGI